MCMLSVVMTHGLQQWPVQPGYFHPIGPPTFPPEPLPPAGPTPQQFEEWVKLMRAAKEFDKATGQPDCEMESKKQLVRDLARRLGVDVADL